jgi:transposase
LTDGIGHTVKILLTPGETHDVTKAPELIKDCKNTEILGDKGYDSNGFREQIISQGCIPIIPPKKNRKEEIIYDKELYKERHAVEIFFLEGSKILEESLVGLIN